MKDSFEPCPLSGLSLQYLSKIKLLQIERDRGEWESLAPDARREKESSLQMFGQLARFHNIMSNETIGTLAFLTSGKIYGDKSLKTLKFHIAEL